MPAWKYLRQARPGLTGHRPLYYAGDALARETLGCSAVGSAQMVGDVFGERGVGGDQP
jgi:hypothetical protein